MDHEENKYQCYRVDRHQENITVFPVVGDEPTTTLEWLTVHYRIRGWNIKTLGEDVSKVFGSQYGAYGYEGMLDLYARYLYQLRTNDQIGAANNDAADPVKDTGRLLAVRSSPQGWFTSWRPPVYGPAKASPFALITSKLPRIHTRLNRANMIALHTTGNPSPFV